MTKHNLYTYTSLGRPVDPRYRPVGLAVVGSIAAGLLFGFYNLMSAAPLVTTWLTGGVGAFLAWAIGRELDPDHTAAAYVAITASVFISLVAPPSLMAGTGLLVAVRLISGTVGIELKTLDLILLVGLAALVGTGPTSPAAVPALVVGIILYGNRSTRAVLIAAAMAAAAAIAMIATQPLAGSSDPDGWSILFLIIAIIALAATIPATPPTSQTDVGHKELLGWRISSARVAAAATIGAAFALGGDAGVKDIYATVGAALIGVAVARLLRTGDTSASRVEVEHES
ncbi:MAG: hypothetical protein QNL12_16300 [Acidimicrobiia bacterium]|nr:hypothetical protein [Acidimicrobiia bacterium]MDX2468873.1 hypothetical protein [Acidimicrobiia bacterium]